MADNKHTLADEDGQYSDWIELYNPGNSTVSLQNWSLTDDPNRQARWVFPQTNLNAKAFLVVFASGKNRAVPGAPLHTDFSLKASGEYLALLKPDGTVATQFSPTFPPQYQDVSYGLAEAVTTNRLLTAGTSARVLVPGNSTLGLTWTQSGFNDSTWRIGPTGIGYETAVDGFAVYNYLASVGINNISDAYNVLQSPAQQLAVFSENSSVLNYLNTGPSAHYGGDRTFPGLTIGAEQDNIVVEAVATITIPAAGAWTFGVNSDDGFGLSIGNNTMVYPNGRGPSDTLATFYFASAGDYPLDLVYFQGNGGAELELFAAAGSYTSWNATNFRLVGDTANGGLAVKAPVVSGGGGGGSYRPLIATDIQAQMSGINASAYIRLPFTTTNVPQSLALRIKYDDGFVAYLNGQYVCSRNAPGSPQWNSTATATHPNALGQRFEEINLSSALSFARTGNNLIAIQGLNINARDNDFLILPELIEYQATPLTNRYFSTPSPGALNNSGYIAKVTDTKFSVDRGFFTAPFSLSITTAMASATIVYTTDGTLPSLSPLNGFVYSAPITIRSTTALRAAAFKEGFLPSDVDTMTYVFPSDVVRQSPNGETPPGWPSSWGANVVDYGMDPNVVNDPAYRSEIVNDLKTIPSYSIVTEPDNLFDPLTGIYANAQMDGRGWERPASIELIYPDGTKGFHINAGIRIRGGYSRSPNNPKHAFRFFFRTDYGSGKLNYPVFAKQGGTESFEAYDLRTFENYSWSFEHDYRFIALRDQWSRDTQLAMGQQGERGDMYHLYINGQYWGLYNTAERPEAAYGATYFGGEKTNYDVIKVDPNAGYTLYATDGNMDAWTRLWRAATNGFANDADYFKVQGLNVDGTPNPNYENLLDVDNLIDYCLLAFFTGNIDAPISAFLSNQSPNNIWALRERSGRFGGFRFVAHDSEHTLLHESSLGNNDELHRDRTGPFPAGDPVQQGADSALAHSNPGYIFTRLAVNAEFRTRVADHIYKHFFNGGVFTTDSCRARLLTRSNEVYWAIADESARWGDSLNREPARTRNNEWVTEMNRVYGDYFAQRPGIVLDQFRAKNWFPSTVAPSLNQSGGVVSNAFKLVLSAPAGSVYYTLDGTDPRYRGGSISPAARFFSSPISLSKSAHVMARALVGSTWSPLCEATFYIQRDFTDLALTEIMYHPPDTTNLLSDDFEFVELKNVGFLTRELSGIHFSQGIKFTFSVGTFLAPGAFAVLVSNPTAFTNKYPGVHVDGVFTGHLSNQGETLTLAHATGSNIFSVTYGTRPPWPMAADGSGFSLVPVNPNVNPDPNNPANWRASSVIGGSPGADDKGVIISPIWINEILTHTDPPQLHSVEFYNPNATNVDIGNWYLTDDHATPKKSRLPSPTIVPAHGYLVLTENDWNAYANPTNRFRFDSHGEEVYLFSGDSGGNLTGYSDGFSFGAAQNGVTFGRYVISTGEIQYPAQVANTLGQTNAGPKIGPVVINEINYHPGTNSDEFIELKNIASTTVQLYDPLRPTNTWRLHGVGFDFPSYVQLAPNSLLLVVATNPAAFRTKYAVPTSVPIYGPYPGALQGGGETLALQYPDHPDILNTNTGEMIIPYIDVDVVRYDDKAPWPTNADGLGASLERLNAAAYGNDPINWQASPVHPSPGFENATHSATPFPIDSFGVSDGATPVFSLSFGATAGLSYTVQYRTSLDSGSWLNLTNIPAQPVSQALQITDPIGPSSGTRFYRIVTPAQP